MRHGLSVYSAPLVGNIPVISNQGRIASPFVTAIVQIERLMRLCLVQCLVTRMKPEVKSNDTPCKLPELKAPCCLNSPNDNLSSWPTFTAGGGCRL